MGNDGGSIPRRNELVKEAARNPTVAEIKQTQSERQTHLWTTDPLSNAPLSAPIVSDSQGRLYNKDSILTFLLPSDDTDKTEAAKILSGSVGSLKDVVTVLFTSDDDGVWKCPITNETLGPGTKAVYLVPCGHVFSATAMKEVVGGGGGGAGTDTDDQTCLTCNEPYAANDMIPILPTSETEIARLTLRMKTLAEKGLRHSLKKASSSESARKRKKGVEQQKTTTERPSVVAAKDQSAGIRHAGTKAITEKVMREQEASKKRKFETDNVKSLFSQGGKASKDADFMTRGFSIPAGAKR